MLKYFSFVLILIYFCSVNHVHGLNDRLTLGYKHDASINGWMKLNQSLTDWVGARDNCRKEDAFLVSAWTAEVASAVSQLQNQHMISKLFSGVRQIKLTSTEGGTNMIEGPCDALTKPISWARTELCEAFHSNGSTGYVDCKLRLPFICYSPDQTTEPQQADTPKPVIPTTTPAPEPICGRNSSGYEYSRETRRCYKFHAEARNWTEANRTCVDEGAHLAVPNNNTEARVLTSIHHRYTDDNIHGHSSLDWISVGVFWESGRWRTVDGTSLDQSGYEAWTTNWHTESPYMCMYKTGGYMHIFDQPYAYICVKASGV